MSATNHPSHYGGDTTYEVIKVLRAWGFLDNALRFNVIKYLARAGKKGDEIEDLEKAKVYLQWEIDELKAKREAEAPKQPEPLAGRTSHWCSICGQEMQSPTHCRNCSS